MATLEEVGRKVTYEYTPKVNWLKDRIQAFYEVKMPDSTEQITPVHTVRFVVSGRKNPAATNHQVSLDFLRVTYPNGTEEKIDSADPRIKYVGTWGTYTSSLYEGGSLRLSVNKGDYAEITFTGSKIELYGLDSTIRGIADVYVNDELVAEFDQYQPKSVYKRLSGTLDNLPVPSIRTVAGEWLSFPLGIFLLSTPVKEEINGVIYREVEAYDGLLVLQENKIMERVTAPVGELYTDFIYDVLQAAGVTKWNIEPSSKEITTALEWAIGTDYLRIINDLLAALNYTPLWTDENGYYISNPYRSPQEAPTDFSYVADELSVIYNGMSEEMDLFNIPNRWIVVLNDPEREPLVSTFQNDNPESPTSYQSRGRWIVDYREVTDIADQEALDAYTERIAFAASQVYGKVAFETAAMPFHAYSDVLYLENEALDLSGKFSETDWTLKLDVGAKMTHQVRRVVNIDKGVES